ncbi:hypothetical protein J6590_000947 [Homalodisca vitripennis]|nr:hypothetical protein J6590_000947 [Homalodisca vitripennis]
MAQSPESATAAWQGTDSGLPDNGTEKCCAAVAVNQEARSSRSTGGSDARLGVGIGSGIRLKRYSALVSSDFDVSVAGVLEDASFHVFKNSLTTKAPKISAKLNQTISRNVTVDKKGLLNVTNERKVPMDSITLSSKVVGFPEDRTVPNRRPLLTSTLPPADARRRRRPVIRYEEESEEEEDDEDEDDEEDITDEFDVDDDDDDEDEEEEEVEVVEEVPGATIDIKHEYEGSSLEAGCVIRHNQFNRLSSCSQRTLDLSKLLFLNEIASFETFQPPFYRTGGQRCSRARESRPGYSGHRARAAGTCRVLVKGEGRRSKKASVCDFKEILGKYCDVQYVKVTM